MTISVDQATRVISIPQADLTLVSGTLYELDVDAFRLELLDWEDSTDGMGAPASHRHNTEVTLSGVTYARTFEIINGFTVTFEDTGSPYTVRMTGANHNIADVTNYTSEVSLIVGNSAGLIVTSGGSGASASEVVTALMAEVIEMGMSFKAAMRLIAAATAGKVSISGSTVTIRNAVADTDDRIVATTTTEGERTAITYDLV